MKAVLLPCLVRVKVEVLVDFLSARHSGTYLLPFFFRSILYLICEHTVADAILESQPVQIDTKDFHFPRR